MLDINDTGGMVGQHLDAAGTRHGYLLTRGTFTTIDVPASTLTLARR